MQGHIHSLYFYPIKSCAGTQITEATLTPFGIEGDRQWMIVDQNNTMLTQRKVPEMALIRPELVGNTFKLTHPDTGSIDVSLSTKNTRVAIWKDTILATESATEVSQWLQETLKSSTLLRLVRYPIGQLRKPGQVTRFGHTAAHFADAAPLLVTNQASLEALNNALKSQSIAPVSMLNFRPNVVIDGIDAFKEHETGCFLIKNSPSCVRFIDHCQRCVMITIDPSTGHRRNQATPFKQLARLNPMPDNAKAPAFGVNATYHQHSNAQSDIVREGERITFI